MGRAGTKIKQVIEMFEAGTFDIKKIANATQTSVSTVKTQFSKWKNKDKTRVNTATIELVKTNEPPFETNITKTEFMLYERVKRAGVTHMFDINVVQRHCSLPKEKIIQIMKEYRQLTNKYPDIVDR